MRCCILCILALISAIASAQDFTINTIAGGGPNHLPALASNLASPNAIAFDVSGNMYIADGSQYRIFRVDTSGMLTVFAGDGTPGNTGNGGPAVTAKFYGASSIAVRSDGTVLIADNNVIRAVNPDGTITVVAGNYMRLFNGDGIPAVAAALGNVADIALDGTGTLYIADSLHHRVRRVTCDGIITTVAGTGLRGYNGDNILATQANITNPTGIALDSVGNLFVAESNRVRKISPLGIITTVAGNGVAAFNGDGGPASAASFNTPTKLATDAAGNLFISDTGNNRIRQVSPDGNVTTISGGDSAGYSGDGGVAINALLNRPTGLVFSGRSLYFADAGNYRIRHIDEGMISTVAGNGTPRFSGEGVPATDAALTPNAILYDGASLYFADSENNRIRKIDATGIITTVAGNGDAGYNGDGQPATSAALNHPTGIALDSTGNLFVADLYNERIRKIDPSGTITTVAGNGTLAYGGENLPATATTLFSPVAVAVDSAGKIYIAESKRVRKVDTFGMMTTFAGNGTTGQFTPGPATQTSINPSSLAYVESTNTLYISDSDHHLILSTELDRLPSGTFLTVEVGTGQVAYNGDGLSPTLANISPGDIVTVAPRNRIYFADIGNDRIRRIGSSGFVETIAGNDSSGFSGDGGPALAATFSNPNSIAVDACKGVYISDSANRRIRYVNGDCIPPTVTATVQAHNTDPGAWNQSVLVQFTAVDDAGGSGVKGILAKTTGAQRSPSWISENTISIDSEGTTTLTYQAIDYAENASSIQSLTFNIDTTPPNPPNYTIEPSASASGWYTSDVTVAFSSAGDAGSVQSGVAFCSPPAVLTEDTSGTFVYGNCFDFAGNGSPAPMVHLALDKTPPIVQVTGVSDGGSYVLGTSVTPACNTSDYTSFVATDALLSLTGGTAAGVGQYTATCAGARDRAGNASSPVQAKYNIVYGFRGFLSPVDNAPVINLAKSGQSIPVKWQLVDAKNLIISNLDLTYTAAHITTWPTTCTPGLLDAVGNTIASDSSTLRYDATSAQYIFNWKTSSFWAGTCRYLQIGLPDGRTYGAQFQFK